MANYYDLDGIITELKKRNAEDRVKLEAWEAVTFQTKKDGKPFARMQQNISGATYEKEPYTLQPCNVRLHVSACGKEHGVGYVADDIRCYALVKYLKEPFRSKTQNYQPKESTFDQTYKFDLEDIKLAVEERKKQLRGYIATREKQIAAAPTALKHFRDAYAKALEALAEDTGKAESATLYNMICDTVISRYQYI